MGHYRAHQLPHTRLEQTEGLEGDLDVAKVWGEGGRSHREIEEMGRDREKEVRKEWTEGGREGEREEGRERGREDGRWRMER